MAGDLIRFVDAPSASPTTRLDLNDEAHWWTKAFDAAPPRLRRSVASNAMRDGISVGSSSYDARTLVLDLECLKSTQDEAATQLQRLARELDRETNWLMYQPNGLTKPVFFRTFRSDASQIADVVAQAAMRTFTIEVLAEPFALGLKETLGPYTINNNPAAGTNPGYVDLPTIIGDVAAPVTYWDAASGGSNYMTRLVASHRGASATVTAVTTARQLEGVGASLGTDTTNPGGGPDAAMSGTTANNYVRTSFATNAAMTWRVSVSPSQPGGLYRIVAAVRRTGTTSTLRIRGTTSALEGGWTGSEITLPSTTNRQLVDLGIVHWPTSEPVGYTGPGGTATPASLRFEASRTGGTDSLDWDAAFFIPAGGQVGTVSTAMLVHGDRTTGSEPQLVLDGVTERTFKTPSAANPTTTAVEQRQVGAMGGFPEVAPNVANRLYVLSWWQGDGSVAPLAGVTTTTTVNLAYWPRYLRVRPVST
jgi:hypothetical protein